MPNPVGRPPRYRKAFCKHIIELAKQGLLPICWAADLEVSKQTMHRWRDEHPEFSDAYDIAKSIAESEITKVGIQADNMVDLNKAKFFLSASFQVSETQKIESKQDISAKVENVEVSFGDRED